MNAMGVNVRRYSSVGRIRKLANDWMEDNDVQIGTGEFIYDPRKDVYHDLKAHLWYGNDEASLGELHKLIESGEKSRREILAHFKRYKDARFTKRINYEKQFYESLSAEEKEVYNDAMAERKETYDRVKALLSLRDDYLRLGKNP